MTLGKPNSAHESMTSLVRAITSSWYLGLLKPFTNGGPGMPLGAMAHTSPYCLSTLQCFGSTSSTDLQPSPLATWHVFSTSHLSPMRLKHQKTIDCLICPRVTTVSAAIESADCCCNNAVAPAVIAPPSKWRRETY